MSIHDVFPSLLPEQAAGNGTFDDTAGLQAVLAERAGSLVRLPANRTYLVYALKVPHETTLDLNGSVLLSRPATVSDASVAAFTGSPAVFTQAGQAPILYVDGTNSITKSGTGTVTTLIHDGNESDGALSLGSATTTVSGTDLTF